MASYFREAISELRKVTWPTRKTLITHTALVIAVSILLMAILTVLDIGFSSGFRWLITFLQA